MENLIIPDFWTGVYEQALSWIITELPSIVILLIIILIMMKIFRAGLNRLGKVILKRSQEQEDKEAEKRVNTLIGILKGVVRIVVWTVFFMIVLKKIGTDIGPIIASAGIIGLAVGFGAQELVRDFISGFFILLENQVRTGDVAIINGTGGLVEKIEMRTITLRDLSGVVHIIQNGKINTMSNMTKEWSAMIFDVGVAYKENVDNVIEVMREVGEEMKNDSNYGPNILEPIEIFGLDKFGDSAVVIKARFKTKPIQQWSVGREYNRRLKAAFDAKNIEIPFPHQTIYWGEASDSFKLSLSDENMKELAKTGKN
jgi:small conductance mechanosensitive channel